MDYIVIKSLINELKKDPNNTFLSNNIKHKLNLLKPDVYCNNGKTTINIKQFIELEYELYNHLLINKKHRGNLFRRVSKMILLSNNFKK